MKKKIAELGLRSVGVRKDVAKTVTANSSELIESAKSGQGVVKETKKLVRTVIDENEISNAEIAELGLRTVGVPSIVAKTVVQGGDAVVSGIRDGQDAKTVLKNGAEAAGAATRTGRLTTKVAKKVAPRAANLAQNIRNNDIR